MSIKTAGKRKKMAAALAAVSLYLEQEEGVMGETDEVLKQQETGRTGTNYWGHSGRQEMMDMRRLIQLRAIRF